ncbi:MAG TPA: DUF2235 domain-containing protein [Dongiaceae bacterium]|nr:DUF2235 domain-containing protein [Dongiaceae bacterium]
MPKKIVLFSDGTGNSAARLQKTNVWRLYQALERTPDQIAYYDDGVGTSSWKPLALLGGAVGFGLARNVRDIYTFLCRNYQANDDIYMFGFSRGAFTIRILGGLIAARGIIPPGPDLEDRVKVEWDEYRKKYGRFGRTIPTETKQHNVTIKFMGLWDTVDAYGFPIEEMRIAWDYLVLPLSMRDRELSSKVLDAYHALSIDDERQTFHPVLWTEKGQPPAKLIEEERITQVWFAGAHSNLGGGYPDDSLSYVSLKWMILQAERGNGLVFNADYRKFAFDEADEFGKIYNPRGGLSALYRYMPRSIRDLSRDLNRDGKDYAVYIERPKIHESVFKRLRNGTDSYAPLTLPLDYDVVLDDGRIVPGVAATDGQETPEKAKVRCQLQDRLWDLVWQRRWLYLATLAVTVGTLLLPWFGETSWIDWGSWTDIAHMVPGLLAAFLPDFMSGWLDFYRTNPVLLVGLLALALFLGWRGARRERTMRSLMYQIWSQSLRGGPDVGSALSSGRLNQIESGWRSDRRRRVIKYKIVPWVFGAAYVVLALCVATWALTGLSDSLGFICKGEPSTSATSMSLNEPCHATGITVAKGETYLILLSPEGDWLDKSIPASPEGLAYPDFGSWAVMKLSVPLRRHISVDWFAIMAKIGSTGLNSEKLELRPVQGIGLNGRATWQADFTADADGELLLYVNDAVLFGYPWFYENNIGTAKLAIELKAR